MTQLTRFDPFNLSSIDPFGNFDDLFKGFFVRPALLEQQAPLQIKMDVKENENAYIVHAELPGAKKEDIQVQIDGNQVSIRAETKAEKEEKEGEKVLRSERYVGKMERSFTLAHDIDEAKARAQYKYGVLELTLPKKAAGSTKKLVVE